MRNGGKEVCSDYDQQSNFSELIDTTIYKIIFVINDVNGRNSFFGPTNHLIRYANLVLVDCGRLGRRKEIVQTFTNDQVLNYDIR